ncbi:TetR/AcrR family transcriptional regulator [Sphingomonas sp. UYP23]
MAVSKSIKAERAVDGATDVFTRYGYARTTMADIAAKAGMSRPALYLLHPDKDAIFETVIRRMDERKLGEIAEALAPMDDLGDRLRTACVSWGLHGVELADVHPDASDLFDLRFAAVRQVYANFEAVVAGLIIDQVPRSGINATPTELARVLVYGMRGLRSVASDTAEMKRLILVQVELLLRAIGIAT